MRALKWLGYIVGVLIVLILVCAGVVYAMSSSRMKKTYPTQVESIAIPTDSAALARGEHLVRSVGKCAECHGQNFEGASVSDDAAFAKLTSSNLTPGKDGIGSGYTDADWVRAIRYGVRSNGQPLLFMPSEAFTHFNDADLGAIIAYLKTLPPADMPVEPARSIGPVARVLFLLGKFTLVPAQVIDRTMTRTPVPPGPTREYGEYLANTGGCTSCHGANLAGQNMGDAISSNLTPGGPLKSWTEADFFRVIRTGTRPDGTVLKPPMPWKAMAGLTDDELRATWLYLRSVAPVTAIPK
jgi:mono/diheme cytochrome c family protein